MKDLRWEREEKANLSQAVIAATDRIESRQSYRRAQLIHYLRLYGDRAAQGYVGTSDSQPRRVFGSDPLNARRLSLNVVRNMVDASTSKLAKGRPSPQNLTSAGDYTLQKTAEQRDKFLQGHFYQGKFWELRQRCLKSSGLLGTGALYTMEHWGQVRYEYVFPGEILVDDSEAVYGDPRNMFRERCIDRNILIEKYPGSKRQIENAAPADHRHFGRDNQSDQILVTQAWHLPSKPGGKDGRVCAVIEGDTLYDAKWTRESFPFTFWRWSEEPLGFWGVGLGEQLSGIQLEINQLLRMIQNNMYLGGNLKVLVERGSRIIDAQISNALRGVQIDYTGTPPNFHVHDVVTEQVLRHLQTLIASAYEVTGISQMSASGVMPAGMESGRAQLVYHNIETERFMTVGRNDESAVMEVAKQTIATAQDILERDGTYKIVTLEKNWIEEIDAKEALADVGTFEVTVMPASQLPHDFAGKMQLAEQMQTNGWADKSEAMEMAGLPDTEKYFQLKLSPSKIVDMMIEAILEKQDYIPPNPRMNLDLAISRGTDAFLHAIIRKYPPEAIDLLNTWIEQCQDLAIAGAPPPQLPAAGPDMLPPEALPPDAMPAAPPAGLPPGASLQ